MALEVVYESGGYRVFVSPPHGELWASPNLLTATAVLEELSARGCHSTDITDALYAANPGWAQAHDAEVRRRRDEELQMMLRESADGGPEDRGQ